MCCTDYCLYVTYRGHAKQLVAAGLSTPNLWYAVYDFNDALKTGCNWRILDFEEEGEPWYPLGAQEGRYNFMYCTMHTNYNSM
jgi:hypothetical protein